MTKKKKDEAPGTQEMIARIDVGEDPNADLTEADADTKAQAAFTLKLKGASYADIARVLEYANPKAAKNAVERVLASASNDPESIDHGRIIANRRYERLLMAVMSKALKEDDPNHLAYHARAVAVVDRIARINGLDAAQQIQVTVNDDQIREYVANMAKLAGYATQAIEADILDAEIVDEG